MYLPVLQFGKPHAQRQTRGVADVSAKRTVVEYASAQQSRGRDLYQSSHILSFYAFQEASKSCTTSMSACASCSFQVLYLFRLPSFDFIRSMVLTLEQALYVHDDLFRCRRGQPPRAGIVAAGPSVIQMRVGNRVGSKRTCIVGIRFVAVLVGSEARHAEDVLGCLRRTSESLPER